MFVKVHQETFGKSGCRRLVPGQYLAADPKGRAVLIGTPHFDLPGDDLIGRRHYHDLLRPPTSNNDPICSAWRPYSTPLSPPPVSRFLTHHFALLSRPRSPETNTKNRRG